MTRDELIQAAAVVFAEMLRVQTKDKDLRVKTNIGTIVIKLINEDEETKELTDRVKKAQESVPESKEE